MERQVEKKDLTAIATPIAKSPTPATTKYMIARTTENALIFFVAMIPAGDQHDRARM
jgi:hypothetical protein